MQLIKSPLNYTGGKFKLLPQILPFFPKQIDIFVDLFGGGANVSINVEANQIVYNDTLIQVVDFLKTCKEEPLENNLNDIKNLCSAFSLSKENAEGYKSLRDNYNFGSKYPMLFYTLVCHSFNNQIRFNKKGEFNLPFGKRYFGSELESKFCEFVKHIKNKNISFSNKDFRKLDLNKLNNNSFVYADPPYLISTATYNEQDGWNEKDELDLLNILDNINSRNIKFALSNVIKNKGFENKILKEWSKKYDVNILQKDYKNSNYQRVKDDITIEVLITN